ncbi:MAG TPA: hypothetical protein VM096_06050 [Vicinamibacterales bacterium]|nr:hypothetical protein [Vicinamibacterales bacterium]
MHRSVLSLAVVLAATVVLPLGLRAVNRALPGAAVRDSYLPSVETPRPREPFDQESAQAIRLVQPQFIVIGDSMAGIRIDPLQLSRLTHTRVVGVYQQGSPVAYWYLAFKNLVINNDLNGVRGAIFFFRDDQLTTQVQVAPGSLDRVALDREPELDRLLAAERLGPFSAVHRAARAAYQFDRTRLWLEPLINNAPGSPDLLHAINTDVFALDKLRKFEAADLAAATDAALNFDDSVNRSLLPEIIRLAGEAKIRPVFIRVQRRPTADGPPRQSTKLTKYLDALKAYLVAHGAYYYDDWGDPDEPLSLYADGDHLTADGRVRYTQRFAEKHAQLFQ